MSLQKTNQQKTQNSSQGVLAASKDEQQVIPEKQQSQNPAEINGGSKIINNYSQNQDDDAVVENLRTYQNKLADDCELEAIESKLDQQFHTKYTQQANTSALEPPFEPAAPQKPQKSQVQCAVLSASSSDVVVIAQQSGLRSHKFDGGAPTIVFSGTQHDDRQNLQQYGIKNDMIEQKVATKADDQKVLACSGDQTNFKIEQQSTQKPVQANLQEDQELSKSEQQSDKFDELSSGGSKSMDIAAKKEDLNEEIGDDSGSLNDFDNKQHKRQFQENKDSQQEYCLEIEQKNQDELNDMMMLDNAAEQSGEEDQGDAEGEDDDPLKSAPKRPLSPFIFYSQEARRLIKKENPQLHSKQIMKIVQKNWRQMSEPEKEYYKEQSKMNRSQYEQKRRQFDSIKMQDPESKRLNVIQGIELRRVARQRNQAQKNEAELQRAKQEELERQKSLRVKIEKKERLKKEKERQREIKMKEKAKKKAEAQSKFKLQTDKRIALKDEQLKLKKSMTDSNKNDDQQMANSEHLLPVKRPRGRPRKIRPIEDEMIKQPSQHPPQQKPLSIDIPQKQIISLTLQKQDTISSRKTQELIKKQVVQESSLINRPRPPKLNAELQKSFNKDKTVTPTPLKPRQLFTLPSLQSIASGLQKSICKREDPKSALVRRSNLVMSMPILPQQIDIQQTIQVPQSAVLKHPPSIIAGAPIQHHNGRLSGMMSQPKVTQQQHVPVNQNFQQQHQLQANPGIIQQQSQSASSNHASMAYTVQTAFQQPFATTREQQQQQMIVNSVNSQDINNTKQPAQQQQHPAGATKAFYYPNLAVATGNTSTNQQQTQQQTTLQALVNKFGGSAAAESIQNLDSSIGSPPDNRQQSSPARMLIEPNSAQQVLQKQQGRLSNTQSFQQQLQQHHETGINLMNPLVQSSNRNSQHQQQQIHGNQQVNPQFQFGQQSQQIKQQHAGIQLPTLGQHFLGQGLQLQALVSQTGQQIQPQQDQQQTEQQPQLLFKQPRSMPNSALLRDTTRQRLSLSVMPQHQTIMEEPNSGTLRTSHLQKFVNLGSYDRQLPQLQKPTLMNNPLQTTTSVASLDHMHRPLQQQSAPDLQQAILATGIGSVLAIQTQPQSQPQSGTLRSNNDMNYEATNSEINSPGLARLLQNFQNSQGNILHQNAIDNVQSPGLQRILNRGSSFLSPTNGYYRPPADHQQMLGNSNKMAGVQFDNMSNISNPNITYNYNRIMNQDHQVHQQVNPSEDQYLQTHQAMISGLMQIHQHNQDEQNSNTNNNNQKQQ